MTEVSTATFKICQREMNEENYNPFPAEWPHLFTVAIDLKS